MQTAHARRLASLLPEQAHLARRGERLYRLTLAILFASLLFG